MSKDVMDEKKKTKEEQKQISVDTGFAENFFMSETFKRIKEKKLPRNFNFNMTRAVKKLQAELEDYFTEKKEIFNEHAVMDNKTGDYKKDANGSIVFKEGELDEVMRKLQELQQNEIILNLKPIEPNFNDLPEFSPEEMRAILPLLKHYPVKESIKLKYRDIESTLTNPDLRKLMVTQYPAEFAYDVGLTINELFKHYQDLITKRNKVFDEYGLKKKDQLQTTEQGEVIFIEEKRDEAKQKITDLLKEECEVEVNKFSIPESIENIEMSILLILEPFINM